MNETTTIPAILTRELSGMYSLTTRPMVGTKVDGVLAYEAYVAPGDGLGIRHLCSNKVESLFGINLSRLEAIKVEVSGRVVENEIPVKVCGADQKGE